MPNFPYVPVLPARVRKDPLGSITVNQLQANAEALDGLARAQHFADGQHNALEVPWIVGHVADGSPPTGYLFDTAFGGGTLARTATGTYTSSVASGLITADIDGNLRCVALGNVAGTAIESKPHTITVEATSSTSLTIYIRELSSALGAGDTWASVNRNFDVCMHSYAQAPTDSLLLPYDLTQRGSFLTDETTNWNALVENHGILRKAALVEHTSTGEHNVNRIAKAWAVVQWNGASYSVLASKGVDSVATPSTGVVRLIMMDNFTATTTMACFCEIQPSTPEQLAIINGRGFNTGAGTSEFRFYMYGFSGGNWARTDQTFTAVMYGVLS